MVDSRFAAWLSSKEMTGETTERITEEYDTTQPADSLTGTPPLKRRTTEKSARESRKESTAGAAAAVNDSTAADISAGTGRDSASAADFRSDQSGKAETSAKEERGGKNHLAWVALALSIIALLLHALTIIRKKNH